MMVEAEVIKPGNVSKERVELEDGATALALVKKLGLRPDALLIVRSEEPMPIDDMLADGDCVRIISVVSGG